MPKKRIYMQIDINYIVCVQYMSLGNVLIN